MCFFCCLYRRRDSQDPGTSIIKETGTHSVFRGSLYKIWVKLRSISPKINADSGRGKIVVTAGIREAESTESTLKLYWKDDRTADEDFITQVKSFNAAQAMIDAGKIDEAKTALQKFIGRYPQSELLPNALFTQGLTLGAAGDAVGGIKSLQQFIIDYPKHPLKSDAEIVLAEFTQK